MSSSSRGGQSAHGVGVALIDNLRTGQEVVRLDQAVPDVMDELEHGDVATPPSLLIHREVQITLLDHRDDVGADIEAGGLQLTSDCLLGRDNASGGGLSGRNDGIDIGV